MSVWVVAVSSLFSAHNPCAALSSLAGCLLLSAAGQSERRNERHEEEEVEEAFVEG